MTKQSIIWNNILLEIVYKPNYLNINLPDGSQLAHIDVYCEQPLPITNTGYKSIFTSDIEVKNVGGVVSFMESILDSSANSKDWQDYVKSKEQMTLF